MKTTIIGPGSLGCLFAARLWNLLGKDISILDYKTDRAKRLNSTGIVVKENSQSTRSFPFVSDNAALLGHQQFVIVLVKAFQTRDILESLTILCNDETLVITLQNGIGSADILTEVVHAKNLAIGITMHGANKISEDVVVHAGTGDTIIGPYIGTMDERLELLADTLGRAGITTRIEQDIYPLLWRKLLVNIGINPITAITGLKNGEILQHPELITLQEEAVKEAYNILKKNGKYIGITCEEAMELVKKVCRDTAENISSMLQDRLNARKTEIEFINGAIVKMAHDSGIRAPINNTLMHLVKYFTEQKKTSPDTKATF